MTNLIRPPKCDRHGNIGCRHCIVVTDAGKRMSGIVNMVVAAKGWDELNNGYMAFRLDDGSSNGTLYDNYEDALKHTDDTRHAYFCFRMAMGGANPLDCEIFLTYNRWAVAAGVPRRVPDARRRDVPVMPMLSTTAYDTLRRRAQ